MAVLTTHAHAITIGVYNTNDNGFGSLRQAINENNTGGGGATIVFSNVTGMITLTSGELVISNNVAILGPGANALSVNGNAASRVFHITNGVTVSIASLTITNGVGAGGYPAGGGGGVFNDHSTLVLSNCTISGNLGGGLYNDGISGGATMTVANCAITCNSTTKTFGPGGGIHNDGGNSGSATLVVTNSTLSGNSASSQDGGGIYNGGGFPGTGTVTVANCTLSGNAAFYYGGGICNDAGSGNATLTVANCTVSGNSASLGGGIFNIASSGDATVNIRNSILKAGSSGANIYAYAGIINSLGYNLSSDDGGGFFTATGDQVNTDPLLGPLANNGGQTMTHALLAGSPAIDTGMSFGLTIDQRGLPRPVEDPCVANTAGGDGSDIGAFEAQEVCVNFTITAIAREANNVRITWMTYASKTNSLERAAGSFSSNFAAVFIVTNTVGTTTNYLDFGAGTNAPSRFYRIRLVP